jgi:hypothetical protein
MQGLDIGGRSLFGVSRRRLLLIGAGSALSFAAGAAPPAVRDAGVFGAIGDGSADDTAALQAAAQAIPDSGGILSVPAGRFRITSTILLKSGTTLMGRGATIVAGTPWRVLPARRPGRSPGRALVSNVNVAADEITDHDITVDGLYFEYPGPPNGNAHAVNFRKVRGVVVTNCHFSGGGNGTAFLACENTEVSHCTSRGTINCAYDHWEGPRAALVHNCTAICAGGYGILFTGVGTEPEDDEVGSNLRAIGNRIENPEQAGIWACSLSRGSALSDVTLSDNTVLIAHTAASGIGATGNIRNLTITGNTVEGTRGGNAIFVRPDRWNHARLFQIVGNKLIDCETSDRNIALIQALGEHAVVKDNEATGGRYPSLVWTDDPHAQLEANRGERFQTGRYRITGSTPSR